MSGFRQIETIPYFATEAWPDEDVSLTTAVEGVRARVAQGLSRFVNQRQIVEFNPAEGPEAIEAEGFGFCSGLLIHASKEGSYVFSHLEPFADSFFTYLALDTPREKKWESPRDIALIYGSLSVRQIELEQLFLSQRLGPAHVRTIELPTGRTHWGVVFNGLTGWLAMLRTMPDRSIFWYDPFRLSDYPITEQIATIRKRIEQGKKESRR